MEANDSEMGNVPEQNQQATANAEQQPELTKLGQSQKANPSGIPRDKEPMVDESFERLLTVVAKYDEELVKGWRDDIDTLLVFAGLFSAVVTAFLIESYQKLEEDPADKTVVLLEQLVSFQRNASQALATDPISRFQPDASTIRINCFWLLSLISSLTSALFGLLCKQWVREFQRDTPTSTPAEALALRQLRRDSFEKWKVPAFLAALPILLEIAVILFFIGILDLLWGLHRIPFAVSLVAIVLSSGLYFITTLLPTFTISRNLRKDIQYRRFEWLSYQFVCPYKSPQAWMFYQFVCKVLHPFSKFRVPTARYESWHDKPAPALHYHMESPASDWSSFDLRVVREFDQHVQRRGEDLFSLQVYQLRAFEWAVMMFRDSPLMIPHLQNVLGTIPPSVAMSAVLHHWDIALWTDVSKADVDSVVRDPEAFHRHPIPVTCFPSIPTFVEPAICQAEGIKFLFEHQLLVTSEVYGDFHAKLEQMGVQTVDFHTIAPLSVMGRLWAHQDAGVRKRSLSHLRLYEQSWKSCPSVKNREYDCNECLVFTLALAKHINRTDRVSVLITSERGQMFIRFIHNEIIIRRLYQNFSGEHRLEWHHAIEKTRKIGNLSPNYFAPLPNVRDPPRALPPLPCIRYSLETVTEAEPAHGHQHHRSMRDNGNALTIGDATTSDTLVGASVNRKRHTASPEDGVFSTHPDDTGGEESGSGFSGDETRYQNRIRPKGNTPGSTVATQGLPPEGPGDEQALSLIGHVALDAQDLEGRPSRKHHADNLEDTTAVQQTGITNEDPRVAVSALRSAEVHGDEQKLGLGTLVAPGSLSRNMYPGDTPALVHPLEIGQEEIHFATSGNIVHSRRGDEELQQSYNMESQQPVNVIQAVLVSDSVANIDHSLPIRSSIKDLPGRHTADITFDPDIVDESSSSQRDDRDNIGERPSGMEAEPVRGVEDEQSSQNKVLQLEVHAAHEKAPEAPDRNLSTSSQHPES